MVPFLFVAGAMQYPAAKFLIALAVGRIFRYLLLAYFAARYGRQIISFMGEHGHPVVLAIIAVATIVASVVFYFWGARKNENRKRNRSAKGL